jgi:hypothetical protein
MGGSAGTLGTCNERQTIALRSGAELTASASTRRVKAVKKSNITPNFLLLRTACLPVMVAAAWASQSKSSLQDFSPCPRAVRKRGPFFRSAPMIAVRGNAAQNLMKPSSNAATSAASRSARPLSSSPSPTGEISLIRRSPACVESSAAAAMSRRMTAKRDMARRRQLPIGPPMLERERDAVMAKPPFARRIRPRIGANSDNRAVSGPISSGMERLRIIRHYDIVYISTITLSISII